jgi:hypothetical protein
MEVSSIRTGCKEARHLDLESKLKFQRILQFYLRLTPAESTFWVVEIEGTVDLRSAAEFGVMHVAKSKTKIATVIVIV